MSAPARPETGESPRRPRQLRGDLCEVAYRESRSASSRAVADVVAEVLGVDRVGLDDSFYDFGGTPLQAISVCVRLEKIIGRTVEPADILEHDVLADTVALLFGGAGAALAVFTSGSTGRPKGVVLPHRAITRMFRDGGPAGFGHGNVMPQTAPPWWDMYAYELFGQLMTGGTRS
ncbi:AMP-binding protein [Streptomyces sp. SR-10]|uniref:acyl carrier protein n=1 Tax=Streptomyces sp. SR-10 TaxID=3416442 RepID=UPI003CF9EEDE